MYKKTKTIKPSTVIVWTVLVALVALVILFDWNWFKPAVERYASYSLHREVRIGHLGVSASWPPVVHVSDLYIGNAPWSKQAAMATARQADIKIDVPALFSKKILVPGLAVEGPNVLLERMADGRHNWDIFESPPDKPSRITLQALSLKQAHLTLHDALEKINAQAQAENRPTPGGDGRHYTTHISFSGQYRDADFNGTASTTDILSLQESGVPFDVDAKMKAGQTYIDIKGIVADVVKLSSANVQLKISGPTLSSLYPFILLPLPDTPPYHFDGRLVFSNNTYAYENFTGLIGGTDIRGNAKYIQQQPRPFLEAQLDSKRLNLKDLGPLIGLDTSPKPSQETARQTGKAQHQKRVFPQRPIDLERLNAIDAQVSLKAQRLNAPSQLALENFSFALALKAGVLTLKPLDFGFAGGKITSDIVVDATKTIPAARINTAFEGVHLNQLIPASKIIEKSNGLMGARMTLAGRGKSIADMMGSAMGNASMALTGGQISNLLDAASGLNGGKIIHLLVGGDKDIQIRCAASAFDFENGQGHSRLLVVDTEQTRTNGTGTVNLKDETFDIHLNPEPKKMGILSLRSPIRLHGSFSAPDFSINKGVLLARGGSSLALAAINPLLALLPLIETGPGQDTHCSQVLNPVANAQRSANKQH